ncbi:MAG: ATPase [Bacteroidales bacterium]
MILIADGGSTKTDWRIISPQNEIVSVQTVGFNPYLSTTVEIEEILWKELDPFFDSRQIKQVFYYGAGCSTSSKNQIVANALETFFDRAEIFVYHDLLGAARALCGDNPGIACILGTGSNSCVYDGVDIIENMPSLGYFFGDEGSGAYLGKMLLTAYLHNELPSEINDAFNAKYPLSLENILDSIYNKGQPSRFLASFSEFILEHQKHPFINKLIRSNFAEFLKYFVLRYPNYTDFQASCVGSIAFLYQSQLKDVAKNLGIQVGRIMKTPIDGLVEFHSKGQ